MSTRLYSDKLREPTTILWRVLKVIFLAINFTCMVASIVMTVVVALRKPDLPPLQDVHLEEGDGEHKTAIQLASDIVSVMPLFVSFMFNTIGFAGIFKLNIRCIQIYTGFLVFSLLCAIILVIPFAIGVDIAFLVLIVLLINEINKENFW